MLSFIFCFWSFNPDVHSSIPLQHSPSPLQQQQCRYNPKYRAANCSSYRGLPEGDENALKAAVATIGPISVGIDAEQPKFLFYHSGRWPWVILGAGPRSCELKTVFPAGVYNDPGCSHRVNHAVLAVGYGTEGNMDYWLIKNRWRFFSL